MTTPMLDDDRIDAMRAGVMHAVDRDIARRGRRMRSTIGLTAAGVLVVGLGGFTVSAIQQGAGSESAGTSSSASDARSGAGVASEDAAAAPGRLDESGPTDQDRQVITTGTISVTVTAPRDAAARLSTFVEGLGGRVDSRSEDGAGQDASASLQVRVPAGQVSATIARLEKLGTVDDVSLQNDDVTSVAKDLDARIDALQISVERLQAILSAADTSKDVISAESALTQRQEQLESLQAERRSLAGQVELSTITIDLAQERQVDSVEPGGFTGGLRDGWNALVATVNAVVEVVGTILPWAVIVLVLLAATRLVARRTRR